MREYAKKPENQSRTLDSNSKASKQAPIDVILQRYKQNIQRYASAEEEELLQGKFESTTATEQEPVQREEKSNNTGLPDNLKTGIENLSGYSMDDVRVHYNSDKPEQLNALAYTQGTEIYVALGQEKHLPHEAWHVVQQKQGRVQSTMQLHGENVNDNEGLEKEADVMGEKSIPLFALNNNLKTRLNANSPVQRRVGFEFEMGDILTQEWSLLKGWHNHKKGDILKKYPGYELTADENGNDSQLEVIINHIDETDVNQVQNLIQTTSPAVVNIINTIATNAYDVWNRADLINGLNGSSFDRYRSYANGVDGIQGQLQMTGGISMTKLWHHVSGQQATNYLGTLNPINNEDDQIALATLNAYTTAPIANQASAQVNLQQNLQGLNPAEKNQIAAIVSMISTTIFNTRVANLPYPKAAAGPILNRTDFSKIMMQLPNTAKAVLTPAIMCGIVLNTVNNLQLPDMVKGNDAVIPIGTNLPPNAPTYGNLTINEWVTNIVPTPIILWGYWQGKDKLTKKHYPGTKDQQNWLESMGSYGNKLDNGSKPIFEFRSLNGVFVNNLSGQLQRLLGYMLHP